MHTVTPYTVTPFIDIPVCVLWRLLQYNLLVSTARMSRCRARASIGKKSSVASQRKKNIFQKIDKITNGVRFKICQIGINLVSIRILIGGRGNVKLKYNIKNIPIADLLSPPPRERVYRLVQCLFDDTRTLVSIACCTLIAFITLFSLFLCGFSVIVQRERGDDPVL